MKLAAPFCSAFAVLGLAATLFDRYFPSASANPDATNQHVRLLWLGVDRSDFLYPQAAAFIELLKQRKIVHQPFITEGGHTWMNARHYLTETLQLYFK